MKIGFTNDDLKLITEAEENTQMTSVTPRQSLISVYFPKRDISYSYYNDQFDLHVGDTVFVDGAMRGERGVIISVSHSFKIRLADYKRVLSVANSRLCGTLQMTAAGFICFDRNVIPKSLVRSWYFAPDYPADFVDCHDDDGFPLNSLSMMGLRQKMYERGSEYFAQNRVDYISLDEGSGYAVVVGSYPYELDFAYENGQIYGLTCSCPCVEGCKHEYAAMLMLTDALATVNQDFAEQYKQSGYFAVVQGNALYRNALSNAQSGKITFE